MVYTTHRGHGLVVYDASSPEHPNKLFQLTEGGMEGMAQTDDLLYVASRTGSLLVVDISDRKKPRIQDRVSGLGRPGTWRPMQAECMSPTTRKGWWCWIEACPHAPLRVETHSIGGVQSIAMTERLLAAAGSDGVALFSREDPAAPAASLDR